MTREEFMKQQFLTLRDEIRDSKARIFKLLVLGALFVPAAAFIADEYEATFATASIPVIILVLMLGFISEQNAVVRAGRYLKEQVEPHLPDTVGWEQWLESRQRLREVDRYFFGSFLLLYFLFYTVGATSAVGHVATSAGTTYWTYYTAAAVGYSVGGIWVVFIGLRHWHACTRTTD